MTECCDEGAELWATDCETLLITVIAYKDLVHTLIEKLQRLEDQTSNQLQELIERYRLLENRIKELEESRLKLMVGQLAFELNRAVVHKVLANILDPDQEQIDTIGDMEKAIEGISNFDDIFKTKEDKKNAEKKWETLKRELHWRGMHF